MYRRKTAVHTDERVKVMNEIIAGMRVIKMYCWEKPFGQFVEKIRRSVVWFFFLIFILYTWQNCRVHSLTNAFLAMMKWQMVPWKEATTSLVPLMTKQVSQPLMACTALLLMTAQVFVNSKQDVCFPGSSDPGLRIKRLWVWISLRQQPRPPPSCPPPPNPNQSLLPSLRVVGWDE